MDGREMVDRVAAQLGLEPISEDDKDTLLGLAGVAAHASERWAAPLCCYLAGKAGVTPFEAAEAVNRVTAA